MKKMIYKLHLKVKYFCFLGLLLFATLTYSQTTSIQGTITSSLNDEGLAGASVRVKDSNVSAITDVNGNYILNDVPNDGILVISYIGYNPIEESVSGRTNFNFTLSVDDNSLEDVVVVGYGTQKKENLTAAVEMVDTDILENRPVRSLGEMLQGAVPNLNISLQSGAPDQLPSFNIRGFTGINASGQPLILVDGAEQDTRYLNPADIESVAVLKDQAASAIYGSRAPNGVILITTKSGSRDKKTSIGYSVNFAMNSPSLLPQTMNSVDFANWTNQAFQNSGQSPFYSEEVIQKMQDFIDGVGPNNSLRANGLWAAHNDAHGNTDSYGEAFRDQSTNTSHNLNFSGGGKTSSFYIGLGYNEQTGLMDTEIDEFDRISSIIKLDTDINDWLTVGLNSRFSNTGTLRPNYRGGSGLVDNGSSDVSFMDLVSYFPNIPAINPDGGYHWLSSLTLLTGDQGQSDVVRKDLWVTPNITIKPLPGLTLKGNYNLNFNTLNSFKTTFQVYTDFGSGDIRRTARSSNFDGIQELNRNVNYRQLDVSAEYKKNFDKHDFTFLTGVQEEKNDLEQTNISRRDLYDNSIPSFSTAYGDELNISDTRQHWATRGYFFRTSYNYDSKYLLDFNARYDATSRFSEDERWGFFPSVSAGYNIANEDFWTVDFVNTLKLTGSWGRSGDHSGVGLYSYIPSLSTSRNTSVIINNAFQPSVGVPSIINNTLTWAKPETLGFGVEWGMFDNKIVGEYRWYQRTVKDQFSPPELLPEVLGAAVPRSNNGVSETRGWEFSLQWRDQIAELDNRPINLSIRGSVSDYIGYVTEYGEGNETGLRSGTWTPGESFGAIWGYRSDGIAQNDQDILNGTPAGNGWYYPGDLFFQDTNGDGQINSGNGGYWYAQGDREILGYNYARYSYNMFLKADWKGFGLSLLLDGVGQENAYFSGEEVLGISGGEWSSRTATQAHQDLGGYWSLENPDAFFPRPYQGNKLVNNVNDQYLLDLSHLRIRNLTVNYGLPKSLLNKINVANLGMFVTMENLGFVYKNSWLDADPVMLRRGMRDYPANQVISLGLNIKL